MRPSESRVYGLQLYRALLVSVFPATPENENDPAYWSHLSLVFPEPPRWPKVECEARCALLRAIA